MERKIHKYEIHSSYSSFKMMRVAKTKEDKKSRTCSTHRGAIELIKNYRKPSKEENTLEKWQHDNITIGLKQVRWEDI